MALHSTQMHMYLVSGHHVNIQYWLPIYCFFSLMCACVCERGRDREWEKGREGEGEREIERGES